jgi:hypothetical protein
MVINYYFPVYRPPEPPVIPGTAVPEEFYPKTASTLRTFHWHILQD